MNWVRLMYIALAAATAGLWLVRVYAGDPNGDVHGIIRALLPM